MLLEALNIALLCVGKEKSNMAQTQVSIGLADEVLELVDEARGDISRSLYLRKLITEVIYKRLNKCLTTSEELPA